MNENEVTIENFAALVGEVDTLRTNTEASFTQVNESLNLPDYANLYDITLTTANHTYTATENGYLMVSVQGTAGQAVAIYYNSKLILHGSIGGTNYVMGHCVPMAKGDTLEVGGNWGQGSYSILACVFVPSK